MLWFLMIGGLEETIAHDAPSSASGGSDFNLKASKERYFLLSKRQRRVEREEQ